MRLCVRLLAITLGAISIGACSDSGPTVPSGSALVTIAVGSEQFRVELTTQEQVDAAIDAMLGAAARIPSGRVVAGRQVNTGWNWHLEEVTFVEAAIELCDGLPSHVEREGPAFGGGRYCPWSAVVIRVEER